MPFNIEEFKARHTSHSAYQRTNKFLVRIPAPPILVSRDGFGASRLVEYMCQDAAIPGYQLMTGNVRRHTYGPNESRPFAPNFVQAQLLFNIDGRHEVLNFFNDWLQSIIPHDAERGIHQPSDYQGLPYELSYKQDYATDMQIQTFDERGIVSKVINLREAFPSNVNQTALSWGDTNQIGQFTVFMEYLDWYETATSESTEQFDFASTVPPSL